ncbi:unnamed protein product, partial [marine sediment metagenome]
RLVATTHVKRHKSLAAYVIIIGWIPAYCATEYDHLDSFMLELIVSPPGSRVITSRVNHYVRDFGEE